MAGPTAEAQQRATQAISGVSTCNILYNLFPTLAPIGQGCFVTSCCSLGMSKLQALLLLSLTSPKSCTMLSNSCSIGEWKQMLGRPGMQDSAHSLAGASTVAPCLSALPGWCMAVSTYSHARLRSARKVFVNLLV